MADRPRLRRLGTLPTIRRLDLGGTVRRLPSELEAGKAERAELYASPRWRKERRAFLRLNPICVTPGCGQRAVIVDHRDGHQREGWRERFWDPATWQGMCATCHGRKTRVEFTAWRQAGEAGVAESKGRGVPISLGNLR